MPKFYMVDLCPMGSRYWRKGPSLACSTLPIKGGQSWESTVREALQSNSFAGKSRKITWAVLLAKSTKDSSYFA